MLHAFPRRHHRHHRQLIGGYGYVRLVSVHGSLVQDDCKKYGTATDASSDLATITRRTQVQRRVQCLSRRPPITFEERHRSPSRASK